MLILWIFWIEVLGFSIYILWEILGSARSEPWTVSRQVLLVIYSVAVPYGLYGFSFFLRRRLGATGLKE
jgi:hypothetical protein